MNRQSLYKLLSNIRKEFSMIFIPTMQFLLASWMIVLLVHSLLDVSFNPLFMKYVFILLWIIGCYLIFYFFKNLASTKKYKLYIMLAISLFFLLLNHAMMLCIDK
jgi:hypothetical protein